MNDIKMTEDEKVRLERNLKELIEVDNENLMGHYTGAVRTHEYNIFKERENREYLRVKIDRLWDEILRRMNQ